MSSSRTHGGPNYSNKLQNVFTQTVLKFLLVFYFFWLFFIWVSNGLRVAPENCRTRLKGSLWDLQRMMDTQLKGAQGGQRILEAHGRAGRP
jgi:hypothetical protein